MNISEALSITRDHIRVGKGMELNNGVPEALEMVVEELTVTQKAFELAVERLYDFYEHDCDLCPVPNEDLECCEGPGIIADCYGAISNRILAQAKEARDEYK